MKSWADHCSSDEESEDEMRPVVSVLEEEESEDEEEFIAPPPRKQYNWPSSPPYTAFVGNLSFQLTDEDQFAQEVEALVDRLSKGSKQVAIKKATIVIERDGKRTGFGYIEFQALDDVSIVHYIVYINMHSFLCCVLQ
jgi:RNA recognition motif-containing protein